MATDAMTATKELFMFPPERTQNTSQRLFPDAEPSTLGTDYHYNQK
jgi:hypothetical protein